MTTAAIIQARMGSTRLPGKVLLPLAGKSMLEHVVARAAAAPGIDLVVLATTDLARDDALAAKARELGVACFRGSESDVLARYVGAAREVDADLVVRITSDCPLLDPALVGEILSARAELVRTSGPVDYFSNTVVRRYPRGLDTEVVPTTVLVDVAARATDPRAREHVTWGLYNDPDRYRCEAFLNDDPDRSELRWTVDTEADFELVRRIYEELGDGLFGRERVLALLAENPDWSDINAHVEQKPT